MAVTMLHLVNDQGEPIATDIRVAVEAAFRHVAQQFPRIDEAVLAGLAEDLGRAMSRRRAEIATPKQYARVALYREVQDWLRVHQNFEVSVAEAGELERLAGLTLAGSSINAESEIFFAQLRKHLTERDRYILVLMEQDLDKPPDIAAALDISYDAAAKALQRVRERVAGILRSTSTSGGGNRDLSTARRVRVHLK
jgi:DNA-directed RNA polymerase specialized sigma24 family protein